MILEIIKQYFISCLINSFAVIYIVSILLERKINYKDYKFYITLILQNIVVILLFVYVDDLMRLLVTTIAVCIGSFYLFRRSFKETLVSAFFEQIIIVISELIFTIIFVYILGGEASKITSDFLGNIFSVSFISLLGLVIAYLPFTKKVYKSLLRITFKMNFKKLMIYILIIIISINFLVVSNFINIGFEIIYLINLILLIAYGIIICYALYEQNENIKFKEENRTLIENLNEYERMLDYQRISNHENKNQLLVIKGMVDNKNKKLIEYIDEIIKEKREDNELLYTQAKRIPSGGLQGLVYQKMLIMQENNIKFNLNVSKEVRKIDFNEMVQKMNYDICRIVGVFLDNAIEAVIKNRSKEREILISMYISKDFIIEISNHFNDEINIDKITEKGYSTKGKGRGYGLSLVKDIISKNRNIELDTLIINNIFTQKLKIKKM